MGRDVGRDAKGDMGKAGQDVAGHSETMTVRQSMAVHTACPPGQAAGMAGQDGMRRGGTNSGPALSVLEQQARLAALNRGGRRGGTRRMGRDVGHGGKSDKGKAGQDETRRGMAGQGRREGG